MRAHFRLFVPLLAGASLPDRLIACLGAAIGITGCAWLSAWLHLSPASAPLLVAPVGASALLLFAVPSSPLAQPWPIIGGNAISALAGAVAVHLLGTGALAAGVAVGGAILAMSLARCLHPPGGAVALMTVIGGPGIVAAGFGFALLPVALNAALLVAIGWVFHRFSGHSYPHRPQAAGVAATPGFHPQAIDAALADLHESFDLSREDLDLLLSRAAHHDARLRKA